MQISTESDMSCTVNATASRYTIKLNKQTCTAVYFRIRHRTAVGCELYLQGTLLPLRFKSFTKEFQSFLDYLTFTDAFYIKLDACPQGFALNGIKEACECDPYLVLSEKISVSDCDINDQTILRPGNSWIFADTVNSSHAYHLSAHCPFDYCLPHASRLKLSEPNMQCQLNRVGTLCGRCRPGFSSVFASSHCKKCSNFFMLTIILFFFAGVALVVVLFVLNFTVTDGDINGITFYVSVISINDHIFLNQHSFVYTAISLINLDLGIEICFYDGMSNYAKMWLQLVFPFFLYGIALLLIITSRYVPVIQRITAHKALAVLATLFLLSFTKILRTTCNVLFSYSTIEHLPSKHTILLWSVNASAPFSGKKIMFLFVVCVVLFTFLLLYNAMLIFTRPLLRFKVISRFKPLLDCYQGPYKNRFYFWTGAQLAVRSIFFGLSTLPRNTNLMASILLTGVIMCTHGIVYPYKSKLQNAQDLLLLLNLQGLFVLSQHTNLHHIGVDLLVSLSFLQFLLILLNHIRLNFCSTCQCSAIANCSIARSLFGYRNAAQNNRNVPGNDDCMEFREPLIGEFNT